MSTQIPSDSGPSGKFHLIADQIISVSNKEGRKWEIKVGGHSLSLGSDVITKVLHESFDQMSAAEKTENRKQLEECEVKLKNVNPEKETEVIQGVHKIGLSKTGLTEVISRDPFSYQKQPKNKINNAGEAENYLADKPNGTWFKRFSVNQNQNVLSMKNNKGEVVNYLLGKDESKHLDKIKSSWNKAMAPEEELKPAEIKIEEPPDPNDPFSFQSQPKIKINNAGEAESYLADKPNGTWFKRYSSNQKQEVMSLKKNNGEVVNYLLGSDESKHLDKIKSNWHKEMPRVSTLKDFPRLTKDELQGIRQFYDDIKNIIETTNTPIFCKRNTPYDESKVILSRSLVYIPNGPSKGAYVLLKEHGGQQQFGIGTHNRVTLAINLETGEPMAWRSARKGGVLSGEILANQAACKYPDYFDAADNFVEYTSNIRENKEARQNKIGDHQEAEKIGSIVKIAKGGDLESFLNDKNLSLVDRLNIFSEFQQGLHVLHDVLNKTHRDLKPANINMTETGRPKIADFGFTVDNNTTHIGTGSPYWMAPEILSGWEHRKRRAVDPSADIWSSGVILLQMIGDNNAWFNCFKFDVLNPIRNNTFNESRLNQIKKAVYDAARENLSNEGCSKEEIEKIITIIDQCLAKNPTNRPSAFEISQNIANIASRLSNKIT